MKKFFLTLAVVCAAAFTTNAQLYLGGSLGVINDGDNTNFIIRPEVGYDFNTKWAAGVVLGYERYEFNKADFFTVEPYARWSFFHDGAFSLFLDGGGGYKYSSVRPTPGAARVSNDGWMIGIKPGMKLQVADHFQLVAKYGFAGYQNNYGFTTTGGAVASADNSGLDFSPNTLSLGLFYNF